MNPDGRRGVLREEITSYLREVGGMGLPAVPAAGNDGMLVVRAHDLRRWIAACSPPALRPQEM